MEIDGEGWKGRYHLHRGIGGNPIITINNGDIKKGTIN